MSFSRRSFMALASGLLLPYEPERVYSFLPAWRLVSRWVLDGGFLPATALVVANSAVPPGEFRSAILTRANCPSGEFHIHPDNVIDVVKSSEAYGLPIAGVREFPEVSP